MTEVGWNAQLKSQLCDKCSLITESTEAPSPSLSYNHYLLTGLLLTGFDTVGALID